MWHRCGYQRRGRGGSGRPSGLEDEASFVCGVPECLYVAERSGGDFDLERILGGFLEGGAEGGEEFVHGNAAESAAKEFEAGAAKDGGVEGDVGSGAVADLDVAEAAGAVVETFLDDGGE